MEDLQNLSSFNRILIEDRTKAELHEQLSPYFKGSGGVASKSCVKIDDIFDYLSEQIIAIEFYCENKADQGLANHVIFLLRANDLVIRYLGYDALDAFKRIGLNKHSVTHILFLTAYPCSASHINA